jgi:hypothetical protein
LDIKRGAGPKDHYFLFRQPLVGRCFQKISFCGANRVFNTLEIGYQVGNKREAVYFSDSLSFI